MTATPPPPASPPGAPEAGARRWHQHTVDETFDLLATARDGLSADEAARRRAVHGPNELARARPRSPLAAFAAQFADFMILVLIAAALVSALLGEITDAIVIAAIVVLNAALGFAQEWRAERALAALGRMSAPHATVIRDGRPCAVAAADLVPGEAVVLEAGGVVPADLRLYEAAGLRVDESVLTGESVPVDKHTAPIATETAAVGDRHNIAHKGTVVTHGRGLGVVVATGMRTELGRIATLLRETRAVQTPLQRRLATFGRRLAWIVLAICAVVFAAGWARGEPLLPMFLTAVSLAVAAIPEALPALVGISLALGARKMAAANALVRRLPAVETLGSVTYVCSDKTGTLTANRMRVERYRADGGAAGAPGDSPAWRTLVDAMAVSHDADLDGDGRPVGDPTEVALLVAARDAGVDVAVARARLPRSAEFPFDPARRRMTTVHRVHDGTWLSITKGAAEVVVPRCVAELRGDATIPADAGALLAAADAMAADGLRVLAFGVRRWREAPPADPDVVELGLEFAGLVGLLDPPRPAARDAVATCLAAGIVPVMITGDHPATACAVARALGIAAERDAVLTGPELAALAPDEFARRVRDVRVYARVAPEQKLAIVTALQRRGEIVAMTGDGVNDAPALQRADIGVAMGASGTDVAREASAMVLLDDDFATVVRAIGEGRRIYDNLRRFVRYVLTTNSGEVWAIALAPAVGLPVPLLPIQILWMNLLTDGLPGLSLASEPAEPDVMRRPPRPPDESLFAHGLGAHAFLVGLLMALVTLAAQGAYLRAGDDAWQTVVFTMLCFMQLGHVLAVRSERASLFTLGLLSNRPLLATVVGSVALQLAIVYVPACNALFHTSPLGAADLALCAASAVLVFGVVEAEKWVRRRGGP